MKKKDVKIQKLHQKELQLTNHNGKLEAVVKMLKKSQATLAKTISTQE